LENPFAGKNSNKDDMIYSQMRQELAESVLPSVKVNLENFARNSILKNYNLLRNCKEIGNEKGLS
jgi:hypothetical protein